MIPREKSSAAVNNVTRLDDVRKAKAQSEPPTSSGNDPVSNLPQGAVSEKAPDPHGNRRFDAEKVARIKAAIAAGEYKINPSRIADKFIEHDRNQ